MERREKCIHQIKNPPSDTAPYALKSDPLEYRVNETNALFTPDVEGKWKFQVSVKLSI